MKELIKDLYAQWRAAKDKAEELSRSIGDAELADALSRCKMFRGDETLDELVSLAFRARAIEFMQLFHFPSIETLRRFKTFGVEKYNIYIDAGEIALTDVSRVILIGNTQARLKYAETQGNRVFVMQGAKAFITASGYSVVAAEKDESSTITTTVQDKAKILR